MIYLIATIHVVVCLVLIIVVLLQSGKAADLAGAFGGMGSQTAFGPRGTATFLSKLTTYSAVGFMLTSLGLAVLETRSVGTQSSVIDKVKLPAPAQTPGQPATPGSIGITTGTGNPGETQKMNIPLPPAGETAPPPPGAVTPAPVVPAPAPAGKAPTTNPPATTPAQSPAPAKK